MKKPVVKPVAADGFLNNVDIGLTDFPSATLYMYSKP